MTATNGEVPPPLPVALDIHEATHRRLRGTPGLLVALPRRTLLGGPARSLAIYARYRGEAYLGDVTDPVLDSLASWAEQNRSQHREHEAWVGSVQFEAGYWLVCAPYCAGCALDEHPAWFAEEMPWWPAAYEEIYRRVEEQRRVQR